MRTQQLAIEAARSRPAAESGEIRSASEASIERSPRMVAQRRAIQAALGGAMPPAQLKWIDNGGKFLVWDKFIGTARWYYNKETGGMFYRQAGLGEFGDETQSEERPREEWLQDLKGEDPLKHEDPSVVPALDYEKGRLQGNKENLGKTIKVVVWDHWSEEANRGLYEIGNKWIEYGGDPTKQKEDYECSGKDWNTLDEGADVAHDMYQPSYRDPTHTAVGNRQWTYLAYYEGEKEPIAAMILEIRQHPSVQENNEYLYLRWMVAHPTKGGGAAALMKVAIQRAGETASGALRVESARSAIDWYQKRGLALFRQATHETEEACGCGEMGTGGKFKDTD